MADQEPGGKVPQLSRTASECRALGRDEGLSMLSRQASPGELQRRKPFEESWVEMPLKHQIKGICRQHLP